MKTFVTILALGIFLLFGSAYAAQPPADTSAAQKPDTRNLDTRIQDLKKEVLGLNRDLFILEEELLFPATSQVAIFLSMDVGHYFKLDSVQLKIDDKIVDNYLYSDREADALFRGGVQRLHMGNLKTGQHELIATFVGKGPHDRDYRRATTIVFEKSNNSKYLELKIVDSEASHQPEFKVKEWE